MPQSNQNAGPNFDVLYKYNKGSEQVIDLNFENRKGTARLYSEEGFIIVDASFNSADSTAGWSHQNGQARVELNFVMAGLLYQSQSRLFSRQPYTNGYHNFLYNPNSFEENELKCGQGFQMVSLQLDPDEMIRLLMNYAPNLEGIADKIEAKVPFFCQAPVLGLPGRISVLLKTLWDGPASAGLKQLHFESLLLQLLCYQFDQLLSNKFDKAPVALKLSDRDKLHYAQAMLLNRLGNPPSLASLARECQLNEFSLKKGFKQLFGNTVLGFVNQQRMDAARTAIYSGEKTISEIAYELGYASPQYFHRVFKKHFGTAPGNLK